MAHDQVDQHGNCRLLRAIPGGHYETTRFFLDHLDLLAVPLKSLSVKALLQAITKRQPEILRLLLDLCALDLAQPGHNWQDQATLLSTAVWHGNVGTIELLVDAGAREVTP